jgi:hypothetical protein
MTIRTVNNFKVKDIMGNILPQISPYTHSLIKRKGAPKHPPCTDFKLLVDQN